jgi:hypothetical protein
MTDDYPFLLVRSARGGCRRLSVVFTDGGVWSGPEAFAFAWAGPRWDVSGDLTPECRAALVEAVKALVRGTGDTALVCIGYSECVSVEGPDYRVRGHSAPSWLGNGAGPEPRRGRQSVEEDEAVVDERSRREHPFLVIRGGVPGVYGRNQVEILQVEPETPPTPGVFTLVYAGQSTDEAGRLTPGCRAALVAAVKRRVERTGFRICIVFGDRDAVYVEPDGSAVHSATSSGRRGPRAQEQRVEVGAVVVESLLIH